jgi:hypothetical protein
MIDWLSRGFTDGPAHFSGEEAGDAVSLDAYYSERLDHMQVLAGQVLTAGDTWGAVHRGLHIALGGGWREMADDQFVFQGDYEYGVGQSHTLGAWLNDPMYADPADGAYALSQIDFVVLYPALLDPTVPNGMDHFEAYVAGATGQPLP